MKYPLQIGALPSRALARLLRSERITHRTFQYETASYRLSASIERLRNEMGWAIVSEWRVGRTSDPTGRHARYCVYFLPVEEIRKAGSRGQGYALKVLDWEKRRNDGDAATSPSEGFTAQESNSTDPDTSTLEDQRGKRDG